MLSDELNLFKLVWHPADLDGNTVLPSAFRKQDLSGEEGDHVSVDRADLAERHSMEGVAMRQAAKARDQDLQREEAMIARLLCRSVKAQKIANTQTFAVRHIPIHGNPAHCGILNISGKRNRAFIDEARTKLAELASPAVTFDEAYGARIRD